jgi:hypothetical protein
LELVEIVLLRQVNHLEDYLEIWTSRCRETRGLISDAYELLERQQSWHDSRELQATARRSRDRPIAIRRGSIGLAQGGGDAVENFRSRTYDILIQ